MKRILIVEDDNLLNKTLAYNLTSDGYEVTEALNARAYLKIAFCQLCVTVCGRFVPNEGGVVGYVDRMRDKSPAKWGVQMAGMNFKTHSRFH